MSYQFLLKTRVKDKNGFLSSDMRKVNGVLQSVFEKCKTRFYKCLYGDLYKLFIKESQEQGVEPWGCLELITLCVFSIVSYTLLNGDIYFLV